MARQKATNEIESLRKQRQELDARLKAAEARQKEKDRQDGDRRKSIAGNLAMEYATAHPDSEFARIFSDLISKRVSRPADRALFQTFLVLMGSEHTPENSAKS